MGEVEADRDMMHNDSGAPSLGCPYPLQEKVMAEDDVEGADGKQARNHFCGFRGWEG